MDRYIETSYTDKAIEVYAKRLGLALPWDESSRRYFLNHHGKAVKLVEETMAREEVNNG